MKSNGNSKVGATRTDKEGISSNKPATTTLPKDKDPASFMPLGLSNYDALDLEGDPYADDPWVGSEDEELNSNFNQRERENAGKYHNWSEDWITPTKHPCEGTGEPEIFDSPIDAMANELDEQREISSAVISYKELSSLPRISVVLQQPAIALPKQN